MKTSLAPGSKVVTDYLTEAGLLPYLEQLRFHVVGYGCTTCIGNSGPLPEAISQGDRRRAAWSSSAVLQRQPQLRGPRPCRGAGELPRVAAAGRRLRPRRPHRHRLGHRAARHRHATASRSSCRTSGRRSRKCTTPSARSIKPEMFQQQLRRRVRRRRALEGAAGARRATCYAWDADSHLRQAPAVLRGHDGRRRRRSSDIAGARVLARARRQHHDRPHLAGRLDQEGQPGRAST